jgi:hypothetical protein
VGVMTDEQKLKDLIDKYGADNPAIVLAALIIKQPKLRADWGADSDGKIREWFWQSMAETAEYCNEPVNTND